MRLVVALLFLLVSSPAYSEMKKITARGPIGWGSLDSGIDSLNPGCCSFLTDSAEGKKIFDVCKVDDECEVVAMVDTDDKWGWILSVRKVRKIDTTFEPSNIIIKKAVCWASSVECLAESGGLIVNIIDYRLQRVKSESFWIIMYDLKFLNNINNGEEWIGSGNVWLVKRENGWMFYSNKK